MILTGTNIMLMEDGNLYGDPKCHKKKLPLAGLPELFANKSKVT
jgi:hypothetical protein